LHTRIAVAGRASAISRKRDFGAWPPLLGFVGFVGFVGSAFELIQYRSRDS
jgi:hypothetical protein